MHHVLLLLLFLPPSFTSFSSVAQAADWLAPTFSRVPPVADYGWLCSAHIRRLLTPLLSCLLSSPPLNPTSLQPCNGMTEISIEFKTMRSDRVAVLAPSCDAAVCQRVFFICAAPPHSRRPQTRLVQRRKTQIPVGTCLRDVFIGSFVFNSVFVNVVRV